MIFAPPFSMGAAQRLAVTTLMVNGRHLEGYATN
jgi:hypothetical protein